MKKKYFFGFLILIILLGAIFVISPDKKSQEVFFSEVKTFPEFKCKDMNNNEITDEIIKDYKLTLIKIWTTT
ncbi:hypothetical protein [Oceanirhabdus sp. W0125-5]|uniref:hypothetical protein n=1 Tax=Oceanirhabdus sp. W0125-5 TaxID=2999116 RepID=UPI0022F2DF92|nr:hypothetical protein [Oceanirhabdus sp. W0125-5]WBW98164.1 hypothetical protein OW730_05200 [Oceanirhabdus sp. W0125-5]